MSGRLAFRLTFWLTLAVVVVEGVSAFITVRNEERQLQHAMILGADQLSRSIVSATWHAMLADQRDTVYEIMDTIAHKEGIRRIRIFNKEGRITFSTDPDDHGQVDKDAEACSLCHASMEPLVRVDVPSRTRIFRGLDGNRQLAMVTPIYNEPACSQAACHAHPESVNVLGVLDVALSLAEVDDEIAGVKWRGAAATALHVVLIGLVAVVFTRQFVSKPIERLITGTRLVSEMKLDEPIEVGAESELGELARSFNLMRVRLQQAMRKLNEFTQSLEGKVEERTAQLEIAHQKLEQSNRLASLGRLSASVAHEINNPLSGVLNLSMLMQRILREEGIPPDRLGEFRSYLAQVIRETRRIGKIVSDLLAFSRQSKPRVAPADLNWIVQTTYGVVSHKIKLSQVKVEFDLSPDLPPVPCDSSQIQQVVMNLLLNASEAAQGNPEGCIRVSTFGASDDGSVILTVADNGEGIASEHLSRIFDPFFTTKEETKGLGLGLAVVYGIVEAHAGSIEVSSQPGEGTVFTVRLPRTLESRSVLSEFAAGGQWTS